VKIRNIVDTFYFFYYKKAQAKEKICCVYGENILDKQQQIGFAEFEMEILILTLIGHRG